MLVAVLVGTCDALTLFYSISVDYAEGAIASAHSALAHAESPSQLDIVFLVENAHVAQRVRMRLDATPLDANAARVRVVEFAPAERGGWASAPAQYAYLRADASIWARFFYPTAASPEGDDAVVYLDADTIVQQPLERAVRACVAQQRALCGVVGHRDGVTLNSGVLVFARRRWIDEGRPERARACLLRADVENDTDLLHCIVPTSGERGILPSEWNVVGLGEYVSIPSHWLDSAAILHWTGARKPWKRNGLYTERWMRAIQTPTPPKAASVSDPEAHEAHEAQEAPACMWRDFP